MVRELESVYPAVAKVHYLRYLHCMKHKDWEGAINSLYRYFDYYYCSQNEKMEKPEGENEMIASYAVLNLAGLHYRFGHYKEALQAIEEAIRIAHQKNEHECLAIATGWMFRLAERLGYDQEEIEELIKKCIRRASDLNLPPLLSQSYLASAKHTALSGKKNVYSIKLRPYTFR